MSSAAQGFTRQKHASILRGRCLTLVNVEEKVMLASDRRQAHENRT